MKISRLSRFLAVCAVACLAAGCGENEPQAVVDGPCPGESGFGAIVAGGDEPLEACIPDDSILTVFTYDGWYDVTAIMAAADGTVYEFSMMFPHHATNRNLNVTDDLAEARADPNGAWFYYRETRRGNGDIHSFNIPSGSFWLGFSDGTRVACLLENIELQMETVGDHEPAGTRTVLDGFFTLLTDEQETRATD
jgi:hypothetical protein